MDRPLRCALIGAEFEENLALRSLAGSLAEAGIDWRIFHFNSTADASRVVPAPIPWQPDVVGLSLVFTHRAREFLGLAGELRRAGFAGHVTAGGHFATFAHRRILEDWPAVDSILHHEGERRLVALCRNLDDPSRVDGITLRQPDSSLLFRPPSEAIDDLDTLPFPNHADPPDEGANPTFAKPPAPETPKKENR